MPDAQIAAAQFLEVQNLFSLPAIIGNFFPFLSLLVSDEGNPGFLWFPGFFIPPGGGILITLKYPETHILTVAEKGYGKRTPAAEYRLTHRGAKGVIAMNVTEKTGKVVAMLDVTDTDDIAIVTVRGILIRQPVKSIRVTGRNAQGVRLIRLEPGDMIADVAKIPHEKTAEQATEPSSNGELVEA